MHDIKISEKDSDWEVDLIAEGLTDDSSSSSDDDCALADIHCESAGQRKRQKVKEGLFASNF